MPELGEDHTDDEDATLLRSNGATIARLITKSPNFGGVVAEVKKNLDTKPPARNPEAWMLCIS